MQSGILSNIGSMQVVACHHTLFQFCEMPGVLHPGVLLLLLKSFRQCINRR
uniref:Uncharacterized protein n=1 Tax=Arundo donax TaxID=35708 RepID=A0A0A8YQ57_ARUDO